MEVGRGRGGNLEGEFPRREAIARPASRARLRAAGEAAGASGEPSAESTVKENIYAFRPNVTNRL